MKPLFDDGASMVPIDDETSSDIREKGSVVLKRVLGLAGAVWVLGLVSRAMAGETEIGWKFEKDKIFYQELKTVTTQTMSVMGQELAQNQEQSFYFRWTVKDIKDGKITLTQKIEGVRLKMDIAGNVIQFDSAAPADPRFTSTALAQFFQAMVGAELTVTYKQSDMKIEKIEGITELLKKLVAVNQQMEPLLKKLLSEEAIRQMIDPSFAVVPDGGRIEKGKEWERSSRLSLGPIGNYETIYKFKYTGDSDEKDLVGITVSPVIKYSSPSSPGEGLPFKILKADFKQGDAGAEKSIIRFDRAAGRVAESRLTTVMEGELTVEINGQSQRIPLRQRQTTTTRFGDSSFLRK
jgi:hypothetical protein